MRKPLAKLSKAVLMTAAALITCAPAAKAQTYTYYQNWLNLGTQSSSKPAPTSDQLNSLSASWTNSIPAGSIITNIGFENGEQVGGTSSAVPPTIISGNTYTKIDQGLKVTISNQSSGGGNWLKWYETTATDVNLKLVRPAGFIFGTRSLSVDTGTGIGSLNINFNGSYVNWFGFHSFDVFENSASYIKVYSISPVNGAATLLATWADNATSNGQSTAINSSQANGDWAFTGMSSSVGFSKLRIEFKNTGGAYLDNLQFGIVGGSALYWNGKDPVSTTVSGGSGNWEGSSANWLSASTGGTPLIFVQEKPVIFSGPVRYQSNGVTPDPAVVTLTDPSLTYKVTSLQVDTPWYEIGSPADGRTILVSSGALIINADAKIRTALGGDVTIKTLSKYGAGLLTLEGTTANGNVTTFNVVEGSLQIGAGGVNGSVDSNFILSASTKLTFNRSDSLIYGRVISGSGSMVKDGAGVLFLTNENVHTGGTTINAGAGALSLGAGGTVGFINNNILDNGTLWFNRSDADLAYSKIVSGTGAVVKKATGMVTLTGANTYQGGTTIEAGTLRVGNGTTAGSLYAPGNIIINTGAELRFDNSDDRSATPMSGIISGGGSIYKTGAGRVNLSGQNTYGGITTVANGWLTISNGSGLGSYSITVPETTYTTVLAGATLAFQNRIVSSEAIRIAGAGYAGAGALRNIGAMSDTNTLAGQVTMLADSSIVSDLGILEIRKLNASANQNLTVYGKTTPVWGQPAHQSTVWFSNTLSLGSGKFTKDGGGITRVSGVANYTGGLLVKDGQFDAYSVNSLGQGAAVDVGLADHSTSPVLNLGLDLIYGGTVTLHDGSISGNHSLTSLTHDFELRNGTVSAYLAGSVGVRKAADSYTVGSVTTVIPGTVVLAASNSFTGAVAVEAGVLKIIDDAALGDLSSATNVSTGATLEFGKPTSSTGISVAEQVAIAGAGYGSNGALRNTSGVNFLTSQLMLASDSKVQVEADSSLTMAGGVLAQGKTLTANVVTTVVGSVTHPGTLSLSGPVSMAGGKVIKVGAGTLNLNSATDFDGASTDNVGLDVQAGTVRAGHVAALGTGRVQVGTTLAGATLDIGVDVTLNNTLTLLHGTISSGKTYGAYMLTANLFDLRDGVVTASLNGSTGLDKVSDGSATHGLVTLWGNNIYTGQTNVTGGMLLVGSNGLGATGAGNDTVVGYDISKGTWGTLALRRSAKVANEVITISGDGHDKLGALRTYDDGGIEEVVRDIVIADVNGGGLNRARINNYDADQGNNGDEAFVLAGISGVNQDLFFGAWKSTGDSDGKIFVNGSISLGSGKIVSELASSSGVLTLSGANNFSGGTEIRSGKLVAAHPDAMGSGPIIVGTWNFLPTEEGQATVAGSRAGVFRTEALLQNLGNITLVNGTLEGLFAISSPLVELQRGYVNVSLAGSGSVLKTTASTVSLSVANSYDGATTINGGILDVMNSLALGSSAGATTVNAGTLRISKSKVNISGEDLFLNGQGVVLSSIAQGALNVTAASTTYSGAITLQSASRINSDASSFSLGGAAPLGFAPPAGSADTGYDLYLGGKGNLSLSKPLQLGTGKLIKDGAGRLYINADESVAAVSLTKGATYLSGATVTTLSSGFTVGAAASLAGYGTVAGDVIVKNGVAATLTPGNGARNPAAGTWTLNTGNLTFEGAAKVVFNANAISHSLVTHFLVTDPLDPNYPYDWSQASNGQAPISVTGDINLLSAPQTINVAFSGARAKSGVYKVMEYSGNVIGGDFSGMTPSPFKTSGIRLGVRQSASFKTDLIPHPTRNPGDHGFLTLEISKGALHWRGDSTNEWLLGNANLNWHLDTNVNTALRDNFLQQDVVVFDDSATGSTNVLVKPYASRLQPVTISFENTDTAFGGKEYSLYRDDNYNSLSSLVFTKSIYVGDIAEPSKAGKVTLWTATTVVDDGEPDQGFYIHNGWVRAGHDDALGGLRVFLRGGRLSAAGSALRNLNVADAFYLESDDFKFGSVADAGTIRLTSPLAISPDLNGVITTDAPLELTAGIISKYFDTESGPSASSIPSDLIKRGASTLIISGGDYAAANPENQSGLFEGSLLIQEGTLQLGNGDPITAGSGWVSSKANPVISAGSKLVFNHSGDPETAGRDFAGTITGAGSLEKLGTDRLSLTAPDSVIGGGVTVTEGNLAVNPGAGSLTAKVSVGANGILSGSGRIIGDVFINGGRHEPGNSPGLVTYNNLTYEAGSKVGWELKANKNSVPLSGDGYFDRIHVTQNLAFNGPASMGLSFRPTGSSVDWTDDFWSAVRTWRVYEVDGNLTGFPGNLSIRTEDWLDANGVTLSSLRLEAKFSLEREGTTNNIMLKYVPYGARAGDVDLGMVHVGGTFPYGNITVRNTSVNWVDAVLTNPTSNVTLGNSSVTGVTTTNALGSLTATLNGLSTTTPGFKVGTVRAEFTNQPAAVADGYDLVHVTGTVIEYASPSADLVDFGVIRRSNPAKAYASDPSLASLNQQFKSKQVVVSNVADPTYGENMMVNWKAGSKSSSVEAISGPITDRTVQSGMSNSELSAKLSTPSGAGVINGSAKLSVTSVAYNSSFTDTVLPDATVAMTGKVYYHAYGEIVTPVNPSATFDFGKVRQGGSFSSQTFAIRNDVGSNSAEAAFYEKLGARFVDTGAGIVATGSIQHLGWNDAPDSTTQVTLSSATPGRINGTTSIVFVTEGDGTTLLPAEEVKRQVISVTGEVYAAARIDAEKVDLGRRHEKGIFSPTAVAIANYQDGPADYVDHLDVGVVAGQNLEVSGNTTLTNLIAGSPANTSVMVRLKDSVAEHYNLYTENLTLTGVSRPNDGVTADFALPNKTVQVQALVYSGKSHWLGGASAGQVWTNESWDLFPVLDGVPGRDGALSTHDEMTFAGLADGYRTVTLSGYSPELAKLNFGGNTGTTLRPDVGGERILLGGQGLAEAAEVNNGAGDHRVNVPIDLFQDLIISAFGQRMVFNPVGENAVTQKFATSRKLVTLIGGGQLGFLRPVTGDAWNMNAKLAGPTMLTVDQTFTDFELQDGQVVSAYYLDNALLAPQIVRADTAEKTTAGTVRLGTATQLTRADADKIQFAINSGDLPVQAGTLYNNARLIPWAAGGVSPSITVWDKATLGGVGYSGAIRVQSGGTLAPGNSIGTITTTDLNIAQGATYHVEFNGDGADNTVVTAPGGATVKGGIKVTFYPGNIDVASKVFTIIEHSSGIHDINPDLSVDLDIVKNGVFFDAETAKLYPSLTPSIRTFADHTELYFALYRNLGEPRTISSVPNIMGRTQSMFVHSIAGDPYARLLAHGPSAAQGITQNSLLSAKDNLDESVSGAQDNTWVEGYAQAIQAKQGSGLWGYDYQLGGVAAGIDLIRDKDWVMGLAFGLSQSESKHEYNHDKTSATAYDLGLYTAATGDDSTVSFVAFYSNYEVTHTRFVEMGITTKPATGKPKAFRTGVELGYDTNVLRTPDSKTYLRMGLGAGLAHRNAFTETGDEAIAMNFDAVNMPYFQLDVGMGYSTDLFKDDKSWQLFGEGMFTRHVVGSNPTCQARFVTPVGVSGEVTVPSPEYTYIQFQPTVGVSWREGLGSAEFKVFAEIRGGKTAPGASASYKVRF